MNLQSHVRLPGRWPRLILVCLVLAAPAVAQDRPLRTPDATIVSPGTLKAQVGFDFLQDVDFPLSGLGGDLTSAGVLNLRLGVGKIVEVQLEGTVRHFLDVQRQSGGFVTPVLTGPHSANDTGDFSLFTKIRILGETPKRPAFAMRLGFQMPNSNQARGLGANATNVFVEMILQKHFGRLLVYGSAGIAILQAPAALFTQNDVLTYGVAFRYPLHRRVNLLGEVNGRHSTRDIGPSLLGTEDTSYARFGFQVFAGGFQWDVAGMAGLARRDARTGFTFGISKDVRLFDYDRIR